MQAWGEKIKSAQLDSVDSALLSSRYAIRGRRFMTCNLLRESESFFALYLLYVKVLDVNGCYI